MKLLLDTHILLAILNNTIDTLPRAHRDAIRADGTLVFCSAVALWEIAIKHRLGKLAIVGSLQDLEPSCSAFNIAILSVTARHAVAELVPEPTTRDPFDRLLLAQAGVEGMRLVTLDRALADHPLAWSPAA